MSNVLKENANVLNSDTAVIGFFDGIEIAFAIGDCQRVHNCIKVYNIKKIDEEHLDAIPSALSLSDGRLVLRNVSKKDIRKYHDVASQKPAEINLRKTNKQNDLRRGDYYAHH